MNSVQRIDAVGERGCLVCAKHRREIVIPGGSIHQDDLVYVGPRAPPVDGSVTYLGYVMVETRRHTSGVSDLTRLESRAVGECVTRVARALTAVVQAEHVYAFVLGDDIQHFHEHVVGSYVGTPRQFWGFRADQWPGAPRGDAESVMNLCITAWVSLDQSDNNPTALWTNVIAALQTVAPGMGTGSLALLESSDRPT